MKKIFLLLLLTFWNVTTLLAQYTNLDPGSSVKFFIRNSGIEVEGKIANPTGKCNINISQWQNSQIQLDFKSGTIDTGIKMRDNHLKKAEYFDSQKFPLIKVLSNGFQMKSASEGNMDASIEIKGKIKKIVIPFSYIVQNETLTIRAKVKLNRLDFGVGSSSFILSDEVTVDIVFIIRS